MFGAIIGDLAGSIYEYSQIKSTTPINMQQVIEPESFISDDSILTVAIADAILNKKDYGDSLKYWTNKYANYLPDVKPYFQTSFSPNFIKWANSNCQGTSSGNGAMMRISPVGFLFDSEEDVIKNARLATIPSHNSEDAIIAATLIALIIFHARHGMSKEDIIKKLNIDIKKPTITKFNYTCADTIDVCLYSFFNSNSFEECIKTALSFGGDTDTNACITASMAEALYGVPKHLKEQAISKLPIDFLPIIADYQNKIAAIKSTEIENI